MAWKKFLLQEPHPENFPEHSVEAQLTQIEANGYEIRFVFREAGTYIVLAKYKAH
jgi:hypothetical protein